MSRRPEGGLPVEDVLAIERLVALYGHAADGAAPGGWTAVPLEDVFADDAVLDMSALSAEVYRGIAHRATGGLKTGDYADVVVRLAGGWRIRERVATARWYPADPVRMGSGPDPSGPTTGRR